jgi:type III pantothenate kinase
MSDTERGLGADRIIDILQAKVLFPDKELIIIDFGTATTFDVIKDSVYLGGCILPGIELSIDALFKNTAKLPKVYFQEPSTIFGKNTINQINAGIYYSNIGGIKEILSQYKKGLQTPFVIATGGQGKNISEVIEDIDVYLPDLSMNGLYTFAKKFS